MLDIAADTQKTLAHLTEDLIVLAKEIMTLKKQVQELEKREPRHFWAGSRGARSFSELSGVAVDAQIPVLSNSKYPNALLLDGSRSMAGTLNLNDNLLKFGSDVVLRKVASDQIAVTSEGSATNYLKFRAAYVFATNSFQAALYYPLGAAHGYFRTYNATDKHFYFQSYNGSYVNTIDLYNGKVLMPSLPVADPHVVGELWNNGGVVTVSSG